MDLQCTILELSYPIQFHYSLNLCGMDSVSNEIELGNSK